MKREKIVLLLVIFVFLFNGCIKNSDRVKTATLANKNSDRVETATSTNTNSDRVETTTSTNQEKDVQKPNEQITQRVDVTPKVNNKIEGNEKNVQENFYGNWRIKKLIATIPVLDRDIDEINSIIGKKLAYSKDYVQYDGTTYHEPFYKTTELNQNDFLVDYKVSFEKLNLKGTKIIEVTIFSDEQQKHAIAKVGNVLYICEDKSIILYAQGGFFQLEKIQNDYNEEPNNIVNKDTVKVGDKLAGIIVKSVDKKDGYLLDVSFSGSVEVSGSFQWDNYGDGEGYIFTLDESSKKKVPVLKEINNSGSFVIKNSDLAQKLLSKKNGKAKIVINNYSLGERQITSSATLDKALEVN